MFALRMPPGLFIVLQFFTQTAQAGFQVPASGCDELDLKPCLCAGVRWAVYEVAHNVFIISHPGVFKACRSIEVILTFFHAGTLKCQRSASEQCMAVIS